MMSVQPYGKPSSGVIVPHPATDSPCALTRTDWSTRTVNWTPQLGAHGGERPVSVTLAIASTTARRQG
jgi:hypothetical protein